MDPDQEHVPKRLGQLILRLGRARSQELLGEERIARGAADDRGHETGIRSLSGDRLHLASDIVGAQAQKLEAGDRDNRSISASHGRSGWRRWSSSER